MEADYGDTQCFMRSRERFRHGAGNGGFEGNMAITKVERVAGDIVKNFDTRAHRQLEVEFYTLIRKHPAFKSAASYVLKELFYV